MKIVIEDPRDVKKIGTYCMVCGRNLGEITYVDSLTTFNHLDTMPICRKCFTEYGLKLCSMSEYQHPHQS